MDPRTVTDSSLSEWIDREVARPLERIGVYLHTIGIFRGAPWCTAAMSARPFPARGNTRAACARVC
eukprot:6263113-Prymnesium_polylepis.1